MRSYNDFKEDSVPKVPIRDAIWAPPDAGIHKLNFDAGTVGVNYHGWGYVIRNNLGDVEMMGVK